ncbi:MFS transporter [Candidatus Pacearchaeota archaeon]|nr:MFS transporter [Candidatus Pacearchaeota archaeon]
MKSGVVKADHPIVQKKIDRSLKLSVQDGAAASIASSFSLSYFAPAALAMGASVVQMGILHAVISLLPNIVQLKAAALIERFSRRRIVLTGVMWKIFLVFPLLLIGYLHWIGVPHMVWAFIGIVGLHYCFQAIIHPAWFSWMGSLVPEEKRGKYFSKRNRIVGLFGVVSMIAGAFILDGMEKAGGLYGNVVGFTLLGFGILFVLSGASRLWSWELLRRSYEPKIKIRKKDCFSFTDFMKRCKDTPFGRFSLFAAAFTFAVGISSPFWAVYMIRDLGFSYVWFMAITVASVIFQLVFLPLLGKFSDKYGNIKLMRICSLILGAVPFLWVASILIENSLMVKIYLLIVPSAVAGFGWAGYNLALNNYVYDAVSNRKRGFGLSYMNLLIGIGGFVGAGLGSIIAWMDISFMNSSMLFIFVVSGVCRFGIAIYGAKRLHEVRNVRHFSSQFWVREFAPAQGIIREIHNLEHIVEKIEYYVSPKEKAEFELAKKEHRI